MTSSRSTLNKERIRREGRTHIIGKDGVSYALIARVDENEKAAIISAFPGLNRSRIFNPDNCNIIYPYKVVLDEGTFSRARIALRINRDGSSEYVAVRKIKKNLARKYDRTQAIKMTMREMDLQATMKSKLHPDYFSLNTEYVVTKNSLEQVQIYQFSPIADIGNLARLLQLLEDAPDNLLTPQEFSDLFTHIMLRTMTALVIAHQANIYHRDVKPENILINSSGRIALTDFGSSVFFNANGDEIFVEKMTDHHYSLPEHVMDFQNSHASQQHAARDTWSLGLTLLQCLGKDMREFIASGYLMASHNAYDELHNALKVKLTQLNLPDNITSILLDTVNHRVDKRHSLPSLLNQFNNTTIMISTERVQAILSKLIKYHHDKDQTNSSDSDAILSHCISKILASPLFKHHLSCNNHIREQSILDDMMKTMSLNDSPLSSKVIALNKVIHHAFPYKPNLFSHPHEGDIFNRFTIAITKLAKNINDTTGREMIANLYNEISKQRDTERISKYIY